MLEALGAADCQAEAHQAKVAAMKLTQESMALVLMASLSHLECEPGHCERDLPEITTAASGWTVALRP